MADVYSNKSFVSCLSYEEKVLLQFQDVEDTVNVLWFSCIVEFTLYVDAIDALDPEPFVVGDHHGPSPLE